MRRFRLLALVGAVLVALGSVVVTAGPAAADEDIPPAPAQVNRWYDGCTSPFGASPGGNNFTDACNWHDLCYAGRIAGYSKATCDQTFHGFMDTICYYNYGNSSNCRGWSAAYYSGVSLFGWWFYTGPTETFP